MRRHSWILLPRYTTLAGPGVFVTVPMQVTEFEGAALDIWRGALVGASATIGFWPQESSDRTTWRSIATSAFDPGVQAEGRILLTFTEPFFRLRVVLSGASTIATCYAYGYVNARERNATEVTS